MIARPPRNRQRGFTLIELMVALLVSTVLVGLVMSIYMRMSLAYRTQQQVSELQQVLQAAQMLIQRDVRQAGFQMAQGFRTAASTTTVQPPVQIVNSSTAPDQLRIFYADADAQARVVSKTPVGNDTGVTTLTVDEAAQFQNGDRIALVHTNREGIINPRGTYNLARQRWEDVDGSVIANLAQYETCVLQITGITQNPAPINDVITLSEAAPWGAAGNRHCDLAARFAAAGEEAKKSTMIYLFVGNAYRIDPSVAVARRQLAVLQRSPSGGLIANDWQDLGIGFTDFQVASRWFDSVPNTAPYTGSCDQTLMDPANITDTSDSDTDVRREWYSGNDQTALTAPYEPATCVSAAPSAILRQQKAMLTEVTISLALRTTRPVEGIASGSTPAFVDPARVNNGQVGDRAAFDLASTPDASRPDELKGNHVYRYTTVRVDVRNIGVGL